MRVVTSSEEMARLCREARRPLGLVPTMGALHLGHLALVERARRENATAAATIFVNPAQFGPKDDLAGYPRDLERDLAMLRPSAPTRRGLRPQGVDLVYVPPVDEVYPPGFDTWVEVGRLAARLEGVRRPGHFRGVATVVTKLLSLTRPDRAYFGQKDAQQTLVVQQLVRDLDLGVQVVVVPTVRDPDGLALSSRNVYLTTEQRRAAPVVYRALCRAEQLWRQGVRDGERLREEVRRVLEAEPLVEGIDYVSVADAATLEELEQVESQALVLVAVKLGQPHLIDNILLG